LTGREKSMDDQRARELLTVERKRLEALLHDEDEAAQADRAAANAPGDLGDPAEPIAAEAGDDAIAAGLRDRLAAVERAEARLAAGTFGRSIRSGQLIPDERLEADPAAELNVDEASEP
jgi:DnaK suppressor protein